MRKYLRCCRRASSSFYYYARPCVVGLFHAWSLFWLSACPLLWSRRAHYCAHHARALFVTLSILVSRYIGCLLHINCHALCCADAQYYFTCCCYLPSSSPASSSAQRITNRLPVVSSPATPLVLLKQHWSSHLVTVHHIIACHIWVWLALISSSIGLRIHQCRWPCQPVASAPNTAVNFGAGWSVFFWPTRLPSSTVVNIFTRTPGMPPCLSNHDTCCPSLPVITAIPVSSITRPPVRFHWFVFCPTSSFVGHPGLAPRLSPPIAVICRHMVNQSTR